MTEAQEFSIILFQLPDGKYVLQRRSSDAPYAPNKLGIFGGWVDEGETTDECIVREIKEETSLNPAELNIKHMKDFVIPASQDFDKDRHFFLYKALVPNLDFKVYEGQGAEAFTIDELKSRSDLTGSAELTFRQKL